ncbi:hypothetical protein Misp02_24480 [Microtetraspora sp. NBRC 16547]|nr:hypothetical protein Misp02_24480 [Microtetraspora sp. NBRC 16547]
MQGATPDHQTMASDLPSVDGVALVHAIFRGSRVPPMGVSGEGDPVGASELAGALVGSLGPGGDVDDVDDVDGCCPQAAAMNRSAMAQNLRISH